MQAAQPSALEMMLPFVVVFVVFYFMIIRPQGKRMKSQEKFLNDLKRGDSVVTTGGLLGKVEGVTDHVVDLEISSGIKVKVLKKQIAANQAAVLNIDHKKN